MHRLGATEANSHAPVAFRDFGAGQSGGHRQFRDLVRSATPFLNNATKIERSRNQRVSQPRFMWLEQFLGGGVKKQGSNRGNLESVIVNCQTDGTAPGRVVTVAKGVCQCLSCRERRIGRFVDARETVRLKSTGNGQGFPQESRSIRKEKESIAIELPVIEDLRSIKTPKASDAKETLRHPGCNFLGFAIQHDRSPAHHTLRHQAHGTQEVFWFLTARCIQAANVNRSRYSSADFYNVEIGSLPAGSWLVFPALLFVQASREHSMYPSVDFFWVVSPTQRQEAFRFRREGASQRPRQPQWSVLTATTRWDTTLSSIPLRQHWPISDGYELVRQIAIIALQSDPPPGCASRAGVLHPQQRPRLVRCCDAAARHRNALYHLFDQNRVAAGD